MLYRFNEKTPVIGKGTYVSDSAKIVGDIVIGDNCYIGHGVIIRGDYGRVEIGSGAAIEEGVIIHPPVQDVCKIGNKVTIGPGVVSHAKIIGEDTVIGISSTLGVDSQIGEWTIVAEGSVVRMRQIVPNKMVVGGNPAHTIREVTSTDRENWIRVRELYIDLAAQYLNGAMVPIK